MGLQAEMSVGSYCVCDLPEVDRCGESTIHLMAQHGPTASEQVLGGWAEMLALMDATLCQQHVGGGAINPIMLTALHAKFSQFPD